MAVEMILPDTVTDVYLEGMKEYGKDIGNLFIHFSCLLRQVVCKKPYLKIPRISFWS